MREPDLPSLNNSLFCIPLSCTFLCTRGASGGFGIQTSPVSYSSESSGCSDQGSGCPFSLRQIMRSQCGAVFFPPPFINLFLPQLCYCYAPDKFLLACLQEYKAFLLGFAIRLKMLHVAGTGFCFQAVSFSVRPHWISPFFRLPVPCNLNSFGFVLHRLLWSLITQNGLQLWLSPCSIFSR